MNVHLCHELPLGGIEMCFDDEEDVTTASLSRTCCWGGLAAWDGTFEEFMVGYRSRDVEAGRRVNGRTVLIGNRYYEPFISKPDASVRNLAEAVD